MHQPIIHTAICVFGEFILLSTHTHTQYAGDRRKDPGLPAMSHLLQKMVVGKKTEQAKPDVWHDCSKNTWGVTKKTSPLVAIYNRTKPTGTQWGVCVYVLQIDTLSIHNHLNRGRNSSKCYFQNKPKIFIWTHERHLFYSFDKESCWLGWFITGRLQQRKMAVTFSITRQRSTIETATFVF